MPRSHGGANFELPYRREPPRPATSLKAERRGAGPPNLFPSGVEALQLPGAGGRFRAPRERDSSILRLRRNPYSA